MKIAILQFFLIALALSSCLNPSQSEGKCTECGPLDVLINGTCYQKIRGCLKHSPGPVCLQCQFGYVLSKAACIREAIFFNNTNITFIPPVKITPNPTLTIQQIRNKLGEQYGIFFSDAHQYFLNKYPELGKGNIKNVDRIQAKKGVFIVIEYQGDSLNKYLATSFVENFSSVKQWGFGSLTAQRSDPVTANNQVKQALGDKLKDYFIYQIRQEGDIYVIDYMNSKNQVMRVTLNRNDFYLANLLSKLDIKSLTLTDLAMEQLTKKYPYLKNAKVSSVQKYDDFNVVNLGLTVSFSYTFINYRFIINKPIQTIANVYNNSLGSPQTGTGNGPVIVGGFSNFTNYTDLRFIGSVQYAARQFPELIGAQVTRIQSQVVAGTNFLINLKKAIPNSTIFDQYELKIWYTLQKVPQILEAKKNGKQIFTDNHNYNQDALFFTNYKTAQNISKVVNIPAIDSVTMKQTGTRRYYKVNYSPKEYMQFSYIPEQNKANLISYTVDGQNIISTLNASKIAAEKRTPEILFNFLISKQPTAARGKIQQIIQALPSYIITIITNSGTYKAVIQDKGGELIETQFLRVSDQICFDMSISQIQNSQKIKAIDEFLKKNYPLSDFNIQLIQVNVQSTSYMYRILYASAKLKQIQFFLQQVENVANVVKASYINFGYEVVDPLSTNSDYQKISSILKNSDLAGSKVPFFTQVNSTVIKTYYDDGKSTTEIIYDKTLDKAAAQVISTRPYLLLPQGFSFQNLVFPSTASTTAINATITKITQQALKKYSIVIRDAVLIFADKKDNNYTLMYKNIYGYQKLDATVDDLGNVVLGRLIITGYRDTDFSNCLKFSSTGKCLSCDPQTEIEYQSSCHKKLDGCLIQPGNICVKCNINYVKSANKCYKQCSAFFK